MSLMTAAVIATRCKFLESKNLESAVRTTVLSLSDQQLYDNPYYIANTANFTMEYFMRAK